MSTPQGIQNQAAESAGESPSVQTPVDQPVGTEAAIGQLRVLVCGLGVGLLAVSLALTAFVYKQNRNLSAEINLRKRQITQMQAGQQQLVYALNELARYSMGKPELMAVFTRHNIQITPPSEAGGAGQPLSPPSQ